MKTGIAKHEKALCTLFILAASTSSRENLVFLFHRRSYLLSYNGMMRRAAVDSH